MTERVECVVIGAGIIGLAVAREVARAGREVVVLEQADLIGSETSSRHSEVIHAGIYYPPGSLKARLCVAGKSALYEFCDTHGVPHRRCGKVIVATAEEQRPDLERIHANAAECGVDDLEWMTQDEVSGLEPEVRCVAALWSPSTGIVDSHALMTALLGDAEEAGGMLALLTPVTGGEAMGDGIRIDCGGDAPMSVVADRVVNCAGLHAQRVAGSLHGVPPETVPELHYCKGSYYTLSGRPPFSRPIYPVPGKAGLGIHVTVDIAGQVRFGPDTEWVDEIDYDVDPARADGFYDAVRRYYPALADGAIEPGYSGIRPKLQAPGEDARDFVIQTADDHGVPGLVNLYGMESPGMTSALAIAEHVADAI